MRTRYVVISPVYPHAEVPHAGGVFLYQYLRALTTLHDVEIVVLTTALPPTGRITTPPGVQILSFGRKRGLARRATRRVASELVPASRLSCPFLARTLRDPKVRTLIEVAEVVGLQWPEVLAASRKVRRLRGSRPVSYVAHELLTDSVHDARVGATLPRRLIARVWAQHASRAEMAALSAVDEVVLVSRTERDRLVTRGYRGKATVVLPYVQPQTWTDATPAGTPEVLFASALHRPENHEAGMWLCKEIWPRVLEAYPAARLTLAGANPARSLRRAAAKYPSIEVTGFVPDLAPYYVRAVVSVAPIRRGGGVQVKVPQAMAYGLPVVATEVALDGTNLPARLRLEANTAADFAALIVARLSDSQWERAQWRRAALAHVKQYEQYGEVVREHFREMASAAANSIPPSKDDEA